MFDFLLLKKLDYSDSFCVEDHVFKKEDMMFFNIPIKLLMICKSLEKLKISMKLCKFFIDGEFAMYYKTEMFCDKVRISVGVGNSAPEAYTAAYKFLFSRLDPAFVVTIIEESTQIHLERGMIQVATALDIRRGQYLGYIAELERVSVVPTVATNDVVDDVVVEDEVEEEDDTYVEDTYVETIESGNEFNDLSVSTVSKDVCILGEEFVPTLTKRDEKKGKADVIRDTEIETVEVDVDASPEDDTLDDYVSGRDVVADYKNRINSRMKVLPILTPNVLSMFVQDHGEIKEGADVISSDNVVEEVTLKDYFDVRLHYDNPGLFLYNNSFESAVSVVLRNGTNFVVRYEGGGFVAKFYSEKLKSDVECYIEPDGFDVESFASIDGRLLDEFGDDNAVFDIGGDVGVCVVV